MKTTKELEEELRKLEEQQDIDNAKSNLANPYENEQYTDLNPYNSRQYEINNEYKVGSENKIAYDLESNPYNNQDNYYGPIDKDVKEPVQEPIVQEEPVNNYEQAPVQEPIAQEEPVNNYEQAPVQEQAAQEVPVNNYEQAPVQEQAVQEEPVNNYDIGKKYIMCMHCGTMNDAEKYNCDNCGSELRKF